MSIYLVIFGKPRYLGIASIEDVVPSNGCRIVIDSMRGLETAIVAGSLTKEQEEKFRSSCNEDHSDGQARGNEPMLQNVTFIGFPDEKDMTTLKELGEEESVILEKSRKILSEHDLPMKVVDVEYILDRKKLFFYFTSEQRIDFRAYVRDLAREFKTRIELRQIGVRDEAKTVRGLGPCGLPCCCSYWLQSFTPICIKMVKEQNLALNPTKISGICGRLMCCMSYEHDNYHDLWEKLPKPDAKIKTPKGYFVVNGVDIKSRSVLLRAPEGTIFKVPVSDFENIKTRITRGETLEDLYEQGILSSGISEDLDIQDDTELTKLEPLTLSSEETEKKSPGKSRKCDGKNRTPKKPLKERNKNELKAESPSDSEKKTKDGVKSKKKRRSKKRPQSQDGKSSDKQDNQPPAKGKKPVKKRKYRKKTEQKDKGDKKQ